MKIKTLTILAVAISALFVVANLASCTAPHIDSEHQVEPKAVGVVRQVLCEMGFSGLRLPGHTNLVPAAPSCVARDLPTEEVYDVVLGPDSLATAGICNSHAAGQTCANVPEVACTAAVTAAQYLCNCQGAGTRRRRDGSTILAGLHRSFQIGGTGTCPPATHNGCSVRVEMTSAQWHLLRRVSNDDAAGYPAGLKALIDSMRGDPNRGKTRAQLPVCLRRDVPVRAGRSEINPAEDDV